MGELFAVDRLSGVCVDVDIGDAVQTPGVCGTYRFGGIGGWILGKS